MSASLKTIIVEKTGALKEVLIKDFKLDNLYKKCGFKSADNFVQHVEWKVIIDNIKYFITIYGKTNGRANSENKYDFPPPIDNTLFFGNCIIVSYTKQNTDEPRFVELKLELWNKMYEKLFGGFEDLKATAKEDEDEEDELDNIPKEQKTKDGYLKDGFVVDSSDSEKDAQEDDDDEEDADVEEETTSDIIDIEDVGSELSEEEYIEEP